VVVFEDAALIALTLTDMLQAFVCAIIGPASTPATALDQVARQAPDIAMLDVNLAGASSAPVAKALRAAGVLQRLGLIAELRFPRRRRGVRKTASAGPATRSDR
jgi:DNA-binding NarL/FixJ family response regulator